MSAMILTMLTVLNVSKLDDSPFSYIDSVLYALLAQPSHRPIISQSEGYGT